MERRAWLNPVRGAEAPSARRGDRAQAYFHIGKSYANHDIRKGITNDSFDSRSSWIGSQIIGKDRAAVLAVRVAEEFPEPGEFRGIIALDRQPEAAEKVGVARQRTREIEMLQFARRARQGAPEPLEETRALRRSPGPSASKERQKKSGSGRFIAAVPDWFDSAMLNAAVSGRKPPNQIRNGLSAGFVAEHSAVPWGSMRGMRNRIAIATSTSTSM